MNDLIHLMDFEVCRDIQSLHDYQVIIWGAAEKGQAVKRKLQLAGLTVAAFCDSSIEKWGRKYDGLEVVSSYQLSRMIHKKCKLCIISCVSKESEILKILQECGESTIAYVSYWGIKTACKLWEKECQPDQEIISRYLLKHKFQDIAAEYLRQYGAVTENDIWILQPGKTASSTLEVRFKMAGIPYMKQHTLHFPDHILEKELEPVWANVVSKQRQRKCKIIAAVREPIARDYSAFWQCFTDRLERAYLMPIFGGDIQKMYDDFIKLILSGYQFSAREIGCALPYTWRDEFEWFDEEIKEYFGIDIYAYPFDPAVGYQVIEKGNVKLFLYKVEKMNSIMSALCDFIGSRTLSEQNANMAEDKLYYLAYKEFKKKVRIPSTYVNHYYSNNIYVNHFYSPRERFAFLKQWKGNIVNGNI